jgi:hypothetical protein
LQPTTKWRWPCRFLGITSYYKSFPIKGIALDGPNKAFEAPRDHAANPSAKTPKLLLLPGFLILIRATSVAFVSSCSPRTLPFSLALCKPKRMTSLPGRP